MLKNHPSCYKKVFRPIRKRYPRYSIHLGFAVYKTSGRNDSVAIANKGLELGAAW